jgi:hypothetical protein
LPTRRRPEKSFPRRQVRPVTPPILANAGKPLRYSGSSLIRSALAVVRCVAKAARSVITAFPVAPGLRGYPAKAEFTSMLPGFRFLFAAIVLSLSVLVFGLGAAALLRAAHEEFASIPSWHAPPEPVFAQPGDTTRPVLAMMRVDAPGVEKPSVAGKPLDNTPAEGPSPPAEPEKIAALKMEEPSPPEIAKPELPAAEPAPPGAETPVQAETAAASAEETKVAATEQATPPANDAAPAAAEPVGIQASPAADNLATKIATLGGPAVAIEAPPAAKAADEKPHDSAIKKRQQARRTVQRHRRARLAAQTLQPAADPFSQPTITVRKR